MLSIKSAVKMLPLLLLLSFNSFAQQPAQTVPGFTFFTFEKHSFTDKNLAAGKTLFFVFFDAACEHCKHAIKEINQQYNQLKKVAVYLVSLDGKEKMNSFLDKYGPGLKNKKNVTLMLDSQNEFILKFKPKKYPSLFLYSSKKQLIMYDDNEENLYKFWQKIKN